MIRTVQGDIALENLGYTMVHEHLLMTRGWPLVHEPDFRLDSVAAAIEEVGILVDAGGNTVVEMTPLGFGRDPDGLVEVAQSTGLNIIGCTGFHKLSYYSDAHWLYHYDVDTVAELLVDEIVEGMDRLGLEGPIIDRSPARAGIIKVATQYQTLDEITSKLFNAAATAHLETGAPIGTHTEKGTMGHAQLEILTSAGVSPDAVILGHIDHNPDVELLVDLAKQGAYLGFDMPGRVKYAPDSQTIELIQRVSDRGYAHRILLGSDLARRSYWHSHGGGPGLGYLLNEFLPRLEREGLAEVAHRALTTNAAEALRVRQ